MNPLDQYIRLKLDEGGCYVKRDSVKELKNVGALIFDCDGVLIDARRSYDRTIIETVKYIVSNLFSLNLDQEPISSFVIDKIRDSGGFNNDMNTCYAILLYIFTKLSEDIRERFQDLSIHYRNCLPEEPLERLDFIHRLFESSGSVSSKNLDSEIIEEGLVKLASKLDESGIESIEAKILNDVSDGERMKIGLEGFKKILSYPGVVGKSLIATVFDEIFYGPRLFSQLHGLEPRIGLKRGLIEYDDIIISSEALKELERRFGNRNLIIVSGRSRLATGFTLKDLVKYFNLDSSIFIEDEERSQIKKYGVVETRVGKPEPYSLIKAGRRLDFDRRIIYLGDSVEDLIMTERANIQSKNFLFAGIYGYVNSPISRRDLFLKLKADLVTESINDLPKVLDILEDL